MASARMNRIAFVLFALPMGAMCATDCSTMPGLKWDTAEKCCKPDNTKCNGGTVVTCGAGKWPDTTKYGTAIAGGSDATESDKVIACCGPKATCKDVMCGASFGSFYKRKAGVTDTTECEASAAACAPLGLDGDVCCELDATKCGGVAETSKTCDSGMYWADSKAATNVGSDAKAACCLAVATCDKVTCSTGLKKKLGVGSTTKCAAANGSPADCGAALSECCESDATTPGTTMDIPAICSVTGSQASGTQEQQAMSLILTVTGVAVALSQ